MFYFSKIILKLSVVAVLLALVGCAGGEVIEEGYYNPDSRAARAWRDEHTGDGSNPGPNDPGYTGPDGEYSLYPDNDPH